MMAAEQVKARVDIVDVVSRYTDLRRRGDEYIGLCPLHKEKTPSFTVDAVKQVYHCFGCGAGGDVIAFLMAAEGLTFRAACERLGGTVTTAPKPAKPKPKPQKAETPPPDNTQYFRICRDRLDGSAGAIWLAEKRGIPYGVAEFCGVGFDSEFTYYRKADGAKVTGKFLIFPFDNGGFNARNIDPNAPEADRKRNATEYKTGLFPAMWFWALPEGMTDPFYIYIVEGACDAMTFIGKGYGAVSIGGAGNVDLLLGELEYIKTRRRITAPFIVYMDADDAGRKASERLSAGLVKLGIVHTTKEWANAERGEND